MNWQEKFAALQALGCDTSLRMREPGNWYVSAIGRGVRQSTFLVGKYGNGATPEEAVDDDWRQLTTLPFDQWVVVGSGEARKNLRWNGYMWQTVPT